MQSNGFRFRIQVNDKGEDNDNDKYHVAYSWVVVKLRDINDNKPVYDRANIEVQVFENTEVGKTLEKFVANDPDQGGKSKVSYAIDRSSDRQRQFSINQEGVVKIQRQLDREMTPRHQVKILAIDDGVPARTATATLTVIVQDINDNAPKFLKDYRPVLPEHVPPRKVVEILATDDDDRSKSNGPPFQFRLDPGADDIIRASFKVEQDQSKCHCQKYILIPFQDKSHQSSILVCNSFISLFPSYLLLYFHRGCQRRRYGHRVIVAFIRSRATEGIPNSDCHQRPRQPSNDRHQHTDRHHWRCERQQNAARFKGYIRL